MKRLLAAFIAVLMLASLVACGGDGDDSSVIETSGVPTVSGNASDESNNASSDISGSGSEPSTGESADDSSSESAIEDDSQGGDIFTNSDPSEDDSSVDAGTTSEDDTPSEPDDDTSSSDTSEDDPLAEGGADNPYLVLPDDNMQIVTVSIPAGKSVYYQVYRVGGMILTVNSSSINIVCNDKTYKPSKGVLSFKVMTAMPSEAVTFEIRNTGSDAASYTLMFANELGSYQNPVSVSSLTETHKISVPADWSAGYYFTYTAEKNGTICFAISANKDFFMSVTNNRNSAQRNTDADGVAEDGVYYVEIEVQQGDPLMINVGALPNKRNDYPAIDIEWNANYK